MAGFVDNIIGSGAALVLLVVAHLVKKHRHHIPGRQGADWALIASIALMVLAGALMAFAGPGTWVVSALVWVRGEFGDAGPVIFALIALFLLVKVIIALFRQPDERVMGAAFMAPVVFSMFSVGLFARVDAVLQPLALHVAGAVQHFLGA